MKYFSCWGTPMRTRTEYFDKAFAHSPEVFGPTAGWYETRKRSLLLAALQQPRYDCAFEPGCGNGALTRDLAGRCGNLLSMDGSVLGLDNARRMAGAFSNVTFSQGSIPEAWPRHLSFDLIVLSEILYYLEDPEIRSVSALCAA